MLEIWKKRRRLEAEARRLDDDFADAEKRHDIDDMEAIDYQREHKRMWIDSIDTHKLQKKLTKRGIELPRDKPSWWYTDMHWDLDPAEAPEYLSPVGKAGATKLIREDRRETIKFWMKVLTLILTVLTGLAGAIIGIITTLKDLPTISPVQ